MKKSWSKALRDKAKRHWGIHPIGTIAFYGPDRSYASKVAVGIVPAADSPVETLERWFDRGLDVRIDREIGAQVQEFLRRNSVRSVVVSDGIVGCPHEEGVDYPDGQECPQCP